MVTFLPSSHVVLTAAAMPSTHFHMMMMTVVVTIATHPVASALHYPS
jgi:hypothetical protein